MDCINNALYTRLPILYYSTNVRSITHTHTQTHTRTRKHASTHVSTHTHTRTHTHTHMTSMCANTTVEGWENNIVHPPIGVFTFI